MTSFADLSANLKLNISNFSRQLEVASGQARRFGNNLTGRVNDAGEAMDNLNKKTTAWGLNVKSVSRVVSGILISQTFYRGAQAIQSCIDAVWEFTKQLEYAEIAYSNMFGDTSLSTEFINVLKDFAAVTPFNFTESEKAARRLLSYGVEYKNVMYMMRGILSTAAAQGDSSRIEQISRALGQIHTYGKLMTAEVRQLTEAGVPAYEILQEKLGLTQEQLRNLGKEAIPASDAINALIDGMTERFGNVLNASALTISGITSNIQDNATMLASGLMTPLTKVIKSALAELGEFLFAMRELYELKGAGGVFEAIFPPEMHGMMRQFAANILIVVQAVMRLLVAVRDMLKPALSALVLVFNAFAPILATVANVVATLTSFIANNATAMKILTGILAAAATMWVIYKVRAIAAAVAAGVITLISKAMAGMAAMMTFIVAHPFWAMLIGLTGLLVGLSGGFGKLSNGISGLFKKLTSFNGVSADNILLPEIKERNNDLDKFNNKLDGTTDLLDETGDAADKAGKKGAKAAKGLLAFDEVFKLNEPTGDSGAGSGSGVGADAMEDLGGLFSGLGSGFMPDVPDFSEYANLITNGFVDSVKKAFNNIKTRLLSAGLGAILGTAIGGILGGPLGAKIGFIAGTIVGWLWDSIAESMGMTDVGRIATLLTTSLGGIIGGLIGGPAGAALGVAIGALVGGLIDAITKGLRLGDWSEVGYYAGAGIGAAIGAIVGGPFGAVIGGAIGALVGWIVDLIVSNWDAISVWFNKVAKDLGEFFGGVAKTLSTWFTDLGNWFETGWNNIMVGFGEFVIFVAEWIADILTSISTGAQEWFNSVSEWFSNIVDTVSISCTTMAETISTWFTNMLNTITTKVNNMWNAITTWFSNIVNSIATKVKEAYDNVSTWFTNMQNTASSILAGMWNAIVTWFKNIVRDIASSVKEAYNNVSIWFTNMLNTVKNIVSNLGTNISTGFNNIYTSIRNGVSNAYNTVKDFFGDMLDSVKDKINNMYNSVREGVNNIYAIFTGWISNMWSNVFSSLFSWLESGINKIREFLNMNAQASSANTSYSSGSTVRYAHADGGIFNREHIARFAENNKAEAIIPLEESTAMQPFVDAVANGLTSSLAPILANLNNNSVGNTSAMQPLYVGTLIADERGLKELQRKLNIIQVQEDARRGLAY